MLPGSGRASGKWACRAFHRCWAVRWVQRSTEVTNSRFDTSTSGRSNDRVRYGRTTTHSQVTLRRPRRVRLPVPTGGHPLLALPDRVRRCMMEGR